MTKWDIFIKQFVEYEGYKVVLQGLLATIQIAVLGLIIGIIIGTIIAITKVAPKNKLITKILSKTSDIYVGFFRGTPLVVQLLIGVFVLAPSLKIVIANPVNIATLIFGLNSAAYVSEIMRSGILSIDKGQLEAGRAVGLSYKTTMIKIIIPQAVKNILPTIGNEFISLIKETSVASFIAVVDLTKAFKSMGDASYEYIIPYLMLALFYLILVLIISKMVKFTERRMRRSDLR